MTPEEIDARIAAVAAGPKRAQNEMGSVEQFSLDELLALKKATDDSAVTTPSRGLRFSTVTTQGPGC